MRAATTSSLWYWQQGKFFIDLSQRLLGGMLFNEGLLTQLVSGDRCLGLPSFRYTQCYAPSAVYSSRQSAATAYEPSSTTRHFIDRGCESNYRSFAMSFICWLFAKTWISVEARWVWECTTLKRCIILPYTCTFISFISFILFIWHLVFRLPSVLIARWFGNLYVAVTSEYNNKYICYSSVDVTIWRATAANNSPICIWSSRWLDKRPAVKNTWTENDMIYWIGILSSAALALPPQWHHEDQSPWDYEMPGHDQSLMPCHPTPRFSIESLDSCLPSIIRLHVAASAVHINDVI